MKKNENSLCLLGISAYYHDSAAALIVNGKIVAAAQEERFTRKKHDPSFPANAIQFCLDKQGISLTEVSDIVFYDKPLLKFERLLETYVNHAPKGFCSFLKAMPAWLKEKLFLKSIIKEELSRLSGLSKSELPKLLFTQHHQSHASSAFYPSPFDSAAVLCLDGVGEWATTSAWMGNGNKLSPIWQIDFPHSLGLLYSAFTYYTGFKVNSGEYKIMGLAPYGEPKYVSIIKDKLIDIKPDGSFKLNMEYFTYPVGLRMTGEKFASLFGEPARISESELSQREMDLAASIQAITEEIVLKLGNSLQKETGAKNLCLAGGVALNCVANGHLLRSGTFENIWIQPAAGDAGGAIGAALAVWNEKYKQSRRADNKTDSMKGAYLGPEYSNADICEALDKVGAKYQIIENENELLNSVAEFINQENVIGWFQGRMEFGPRALGGRSIIGDARSIKMQSIMNLKIKYRESFRPFAPSVLEENVSDYFEIDRPSPYMLLVADVKKEHRIEMTEEQKTLFGIEKLNIPRSSIPAVTHVDYSARIQTVSESTNPRYHGVIKKFSEITGCPVVVNTSFNVRGEPIVCTPLDAYKCFMRTEMDYLVIGDVILQKLEQPNFKDSGKWQEEFTLD